MGVYQEIGPQRPSRLQVHVVAAEVHALARIALELTVAGPGCDVERALRQIDKIRAVVGVPAGCGGGGEDPSTTGFAGGPPPRAGEV